MFGFPLRHLLMIGMLPGTYISVGEEKTFFPLAGKRQPQDCGYAKDHYGE